MGHPSCLDPQPPPAPPTWTGRPGAAGWCPARRWTSRSSSGAAAFWGPRCHCYGGCRCCCGSGAYCSPGCRCHLRHQHRHRHRRRETSSSGCPGTAGQCPGTARAGSLPGADWPAPLPCVWSLLTAGPLPAKLSLRPEGGNPAPMPQCPTAPPAHWPGTESFHPWYLHAGHAAPAAAALALRHRLAAVAQGIERQDAPHAVPDQADLEREGPRG